MVNIYIYIEIKKSLKIIITIKSQIMIIPTFTFHPIVYFFKNLTLEFALLIKNNQPDHHEKHLSQHLDTAVENEFCLYTYHSIKVSKERLNR